LVCIKTTQVHDWCYKNSATTLTLADLSFPSAMATIAGIECGIVSFTCGVLARSRPSDGVTVLTLRKQVTLNLTFVDGKGAPVPVTAQGHTMEAQLRTRFWDEFIRIAAPESAQIHCELTDAGCRAALTTTAGGAPAVTVELFDVQSIAAEESVRLQIDGPEYMRASVSRKAAKPYPAPRCGGA